MSELKADKTFVFGEECEAYKKSEVDKVIAELKKQSSCSFGDDCLRVRQLERKVRNSTYKRCLAMAMWCRSRACFYDTMRENNLYWGMKSDRAYKWHKRWLEIAEKFKEAK